MIGDGDIARYGAVIADRCRSLHGHRRLTRSGPARQESNVRGEMQCKMVARHDKERKN